MMAKIYIPLSDPKNAELIQEARVFNPGAVRSFAKLFHTMVSWDVVGTFFLWIFPTLTHGQLKIVLNTRIRKLASASDREIISIYERIKNI